jgi:hypothetical protein
MNGSSVVGAALTDGGTDGFGVVAQVGGATGPTTEPIRRARAKVIAAFTRIVGVRVTTRLPAQEADP